MASPSQKRHRIKKGILLSAVLIVVVLLMAFLIHSYKPPQETGAPSETDKLFKLNLRQYANTITVDNGKFFVMDDHGNLTCVDAQNGDLLWQAHVGNWRSGGLLTNNGIIYAGIGHGAVQAVDEVTGRLLTCYQGLVSTAWKGPPEAYSIADGRIFITQDGTVAYNIAIDELLWKSNPVTMINPEGMPYTGILWPFEGKLVLAAAGYPNDDRPFYGIYKINPDTGLPLWRIKGCIYQTPLVYENKVILSNYGTQESVNLCDNVIAVTASSGIKIWNYDVGAPILKPTIVGDKLLFAAQNGNFYALNLSNGTIAWKTQLASSIPSESGVSPVTVDTENQEVYWVYGINNLNKSTDNSTYESTLYRMNLDTGQNLTKTQLQGNLGNQIFNNFNSRFNPLIGLSLLNNTAFLTLQNDLWVLNKTDLASIKTEHFNDSLLQPIAAYGQVYVSGGVYAIAYKDIE